MGIPGKQHGKMLFRNARTCDLNGFGFLLGFLVGEGERLDASVERLAFEASAN